MPLTPEQWDKVKRLFPLVAEQPSEDRSAFLSRECADDGLVRDEVERLLALDAQRGKFLETRPLDRRHPRAETCEPGDILAGRFKITQFLAKGGMGEVYEAVDLELHEPVAIKMMRHEVSHSEAAKRFKREIRLAKQVTHPN